MGRFEPDGPLFPLWFCLDRRDGHAVTICGFVKFGRVPRSVLPGLPIWDCAGSRFGASKGVALV
jgi:hypothetical protein